MLSDHEHVKFCVYKIFGVDLLHESELGFWKAVLLHILRLLYAIGGSSVADFNKRYDDISQSLSRLYQ